MNCNELRNVLPFLDDGSLDKNIECAARTHLDECGGCRQEYDEIVRILRTVQDVISQQNERSTDDFLDGVHHKINVMKRRRMVIYRILPVAAVFVAALTISFYSLLIRNNVSVTGRNMTARYQLDTEYSSYIADHYFDVYEIFEIAEQEYPEEMYDTFGDLIENGYVDINIQDIVNSIDEETAKQMLMQ